jgi:hypothetical protein
MEYQLCCKINETNYLFKNYMQFELQYGLSVGYNFLKIIFLAPDASTELKNYNQIQVLKKF